MIGFASFFLKSMCRVIVCCMLLVFSSSGMLFFSNMIEDKSANGPSYIEFLVHVHRQIQIKMSSS